MSLLRRFVSRSRSVAAVRRFSLTALDGSVVPETVLTCVADGNEADRCDSCVNSCAVTTYTVTSPSIPDWLTCEIRWHSGGSMINGDQEGLADLVFYPSYRLSGMLGEPSPEPFSLTGRDFELTSHDNEHRIMLSGRLIDDLHPCDVCNRTRSESVWALPVASLRNFLTIQVFWCRAGHGRMRTLLHNDMLTPLDR